MSTAIHLTIDIDTLFFPSEIAHVIGISATDISALKNQGCKFFGKKTTIRWVREFIEQQVSGESGGGAPAAEGD